MLDMHSSTHGPIFDGRADLALKAFISDAEQEIADYGVEVIQSELDHVLRHPTGRYRASIHVVDHGDPAIKGDSLIYGAWLEGVGSRNKTTRFKGYFTFRRMAPVIQARAGEIANRVFVKYKGRMG